MKTHPSFGLKVEFMSMRQRYKKGKHYSKRNFKKKIAAYFTIIQIYFVVDGGSAFNGYAGIDNILFQDVQEDCTVIPSYAAPITTTPKPNTTPKPTPNFQSCNFEVDTCEFISPKDPKWIRVTVEDLENLEKPIPAGNDRGWYQILKSHADLSSPFIILLFNLIFFCILYHLCIIEFKNKVFNTDCRQIIIILTLFNLHDI